MIVKIKLEHPKAKKPEIQHSTDAGADLYAARIAKKNIFSVWYGTGFKSQIPRGWYGKIVPRSSISKMGLTLVNSPGTVDSNFRGEWQIRFNYTVKGFLLKLFTFGIVDKSYEAGDRVAQVIIDKKPEVEFRTAKRLTKTAREEGGFGSTNKK